MIFQANNIRLMAKQADVNLLPLFIPENIENKFHILLNNRLLRHAVELEVRQPILLLISVGNANGDGR